VKKLFIVLTFIAITTSFSFAQDIVGDWNGTLTIGTAELRLVLHVTKAPDGGLTATLDSIDQGAPGIPVNAVTLKDSKLDLTIDAVHGTYTGKVNADASEIDGTWSQGAAMPLNFHRGSIAMKPAPKPAKPSDIDGDWLGTLDTGMGKLRLVLHITNTEDGLTATMDSPDQGVNGIPVNSITRTGGEFKFDMKSIGGTYDGTIGADLGTISGTWAQMGKSWPLVLKPLKNKSELELKRPQNPVKPYPYREEEVSYSNPAAKIELAATLTIPPGKGPFPAVLLMVGSGPHDRDETLAGHKPFLVLADYLTRKGIVVLRADKRGVGKSTGDYSKAVMADFASDAEAGVAYLKTRAEVNPHKIGLVGHSEGGVEAPMAAVADPDVAFIVMMAGTGVRGDELLAEQVKLIETAGGKSQADVDKDVATQREILALVEKDKDDAALEKDLRATMAGKESDVQIDLQIKLVSSPWFRGLLDYDPAPTLSKVKCPVLAINGEKDLQVPPDMNLPPIRKALATGGNKNSEVDELPGLNHLFQTAKTGGIGEYSEIEETMSPVAMEKVASWILKTTG
jgi:fermentation-respiration switch protein FrsA (DUF1100 family)